MSDPALSHIDSRTASKDLYTKNADKYIIVKGDNVVCGEFQLFKMDKKPIALEIIVPYATYENNTESTLVCYNANIGMECLESKSTSSNTVQNMHATGAGIGTQDDISDFDSEFDEIKLDENGGKFVWSNTEELYVNVDNPGRVVTKSSKSTEKLIENVEIIVDVKHIIHESNDNRPTLQSELGRVSAAPI